MMTTSLSPRITHPSFLYNHQFINYKKTTYSYTKTYQQYNTSSSSKKHYHKYITFHNLGKKTLRNSKCHATTNEQQVVVTIGDALYGITTNEIYLNK